MIRTILHSDLNNFYAGVECRLNPRLKDRPIAVAGDPKSRHGIILAKNNIAKSFGVLTGEPLWMARRKCRDILFVPPHFDLYMQYSSAVRSIYSEYTNQVEAFGLDECWLDVSLQSGSFGGGKNLADEIRKRIKEETGLTVSVGVSFNKIFAKLGSDMKKPDATTVIERETFRSKVWPLPVGELLYAGPATCKKLGSYGIRTIGDLANTDATMLRRSLGKSGVMLWQYANGMDSSPVANIDAKPPVKSIGNSTTTPRDLVSDEDVRITLYTLAQSVSKRLRRDHFLCRTVQIGIRDNDLHTIERQGKLDIPNRTAKQIFEKAFWLYKQSGVNRPIRSLAVRGCDLLPDENEQLSFLPDAIAISRQEALECATENMQQKFGKDIITSGILLKNSSLPDLRQKTSDLIKYEVFNHSHRR